ARRRRSARGGAARPQGAEAGRGPVAAGTRRSTQALARAHRPGRERNGGADARERRARCLARVARSLHRAEPAHARRARQTPGRSPEGARRAGGRLAVGTRAAGGGRVTARQNNRNNMLAAPRTYRYYDFVMAAFVTVLLCSNFIGAAKQAVFTLPLFGCVTFCAGVVFFPISYIFR